MGAIKEFDLGYIGWQRATAKPSEKIIVNKFGGGKYFPLGKLKFKNKE